LIARYVIENKMADLYVVAGVNTTRELQKSLIEDAVIESAKCLGRMHDTEVGVNFNLAASPFRKNVE